MARLTWKCPFGTTLHAVRMDIAMLAQHFNAGEKKSRELDSPKYMSIALCKPHIA